MSSFQFSQLALSDLREILANRAEYFSSESSEQLERELLEACSRLSVTPGLGHRRSDLTSRSYFFYTVDPYLIAYYRETDPLAILAILHSARDVRKLLKRRST